jgi:hypothetical protein
MKHVVSVSLGSPKGDFTVRKEFLGQEFELQRIGTNGDMNRYAELIRELDGKVDAIGLGGTDRYLIAGNRRYVIRDAEKLARNAKKTPVVDGSGIKNTLERRTIEYLQERGIIGFSQKKVLVVSAVDRFGMGEVISKLAKQTVYGDLMFALGIPVPMRSWTTVTILGRLLLPIICRLPFKWFYPTGDKQDVVTPKYENYFAWADIIAGDFPIIRRYMPTVESGALKGKTLITNTLRAHDIENLKAREVDMVVTSTYNIDGVSSGTNVIEGVLITLAGKQPEEMTLQDYEELIEKLQWEPTIRRLSEIS